MFEANMDEYLDEEVEYVKHRFDTICRAWDKTVCCYHHLVTYFH
jgi:recyclin-1